MAGGQIKREYFQEACKKETILTEEDTRYLLEEEKLKKEPFKWICAIETVLKDIKSGEECPSLGSGFLLKIKGNQIAPNCTKDVCVIVTARHVIRCPEDYILVEYRIRFPGLDSKVHSVTDVDTDTVTWQHSHWDIGAIIPPASLQLTEGDGFVCNPALGSKLEPAEKVHVHGFPSPGQKHTEVLYGLSNKIPDNWPVMVGSDGNISEVNISLEEIKHKVNTEPGNSGCPLLFHSRGDWVVAGVHFYGDGEAGFNKAVLLTENNLKRIHKWSRNIPRESAQNESNPAAASIPASNPPPYQARDPARDDVGGCSINVQQQGGHIGKNIVGRDMTVHNF